ncbi:hypothetical protein B0H13DRAFT_1912461 [Mycena leptocephala]|nr:hypothetical protein B0H13DRAFT_1912461 [Mycena leptocephala]
MGRRRFVDIDVGGDDFQPTSVTSDRGIYFSSDGRRREEELLNVTHKKRRVQPSKLNDSYGEWIPIPDDSLDDEESRDSESNPINAVNAVPGASTQDDPMSLWRPLKQEFSDELVRHDGLADDFGNPRCAHCERPYDVDEPTLTRIFKCTDCGQFLQCKNCCLSRHALTPLHVIREWTGEFWIDASLASLGLVYQLGHGGFPCVVPDEKVYKMTVIEAPIIHQIRIRYCNCSKSDNADHLQQLLRNAWYPATDRYKQFQRMARQWAFLKRIKRAGRTHDPAGIDSTEMRSCAVICWACPQDGRNLPENWRDVDPRFRFLFMLMLAVDANFRLKNRMRTNEIDDPPLGPGWSYWVESGRYKKHLKKYVGEKDISTCIAFAALLQKDTRMTTGLRVSGVGGRANDTPERNAKLPEDIQLPLGSFSLQCALPVWHAASHNEECKNANSLSFKPGVGKSDGEGVERVWSVMNPAAHHTKDAGRGQRVDTLEDKMDSHNHLKNYGQGEALQRKLLVAIAERDRQVTAFKSVSSTIERDVKESWKKLIHEWEQDPSKPNPYMLSSKDCPTEAEVRLEVKKDEDSAIEGARSPLQGRSATAFLIAGLQIEDAQRRIISEIAGTALVTADREGKLVDWQRALLVKIDKFRELQKIYMPGASMAIVACEAEREADDAPPKPERIKLWMPSQMHADASDPLRGCVKGLLGMEAKLRAAQCGNALVKLRARLHVKRHYITFRNEHVAGQIQSTKARTLIGQIGERVDACLRPEDVRLDGDAGESDAAARKKLAMMGKGRSRVPRDAPGSSKRVMSWIWTAHGALGDEEERLHESVRVEWVRAYARKKRWEEEVMLLREEMRRVLRYLAWQSGWWRQRIELREDASPEVAAGIRAYALKQAHSHDRLGAFFERKWKLPANTAARQLVELEQAAQAEDADLEHFFL